MEEKTAHGVQIGLSVAEHLQAERRIEAVNNPLERQIQCVGLPVVV